MLTGIKAWHYPVSFYCPTGPDTDREEERVIKNSQTDSFSHAVSLYGQDFIGTLVRFIWPFCAPEALSGLTLLCALYGVNKR